MLIGALVVIGILALFLTVFFINVIVFRKHDESQRLVTEYKESWNAVKRQAEKFQGSDDVKDFRQLQELARADIALYKKVQEAVPGYKNTDEYLEAVFDILKGGENYSVN